MRAVRLLVLITSAVIGFVLISSWRGPSRDAWAQIVNGAPAPLPPPPAAPGAAQSPAALPSLLALPSTPGAALAQPTPTPRAYQCSCFGPANSTRWLGTVTGGNSFQARQAAVNSCIAYNFDRRPGSSYIPPQRFSFFPTPSAAIGTSETEPGLPTLQAPGLSGFALLSSPRAIILRLCSLCACN